MQGSRAGLASIVGACVIWGLSPLYWKLLSEVAPLDVLAHRTLWSLVFFAAVLALRGRLGRVREALADRRSARILAFSALTISCNWFLFVYAIQVGQATDASLGYYIFPLVAVLFGVVGFGERLRRLELAAVALAGGAVALLAWREGALPWISLVLATSFGLYGMAKKHLSTHAVVSVTAEVVLLAPLALGWLLWQRAGGAPVFGASLAQGGLLVLSGPLTAVPLILFSHASQRVALSTVGLVQYLNPTLQFLVAVLVFREPFGLAQAMTFALIWTALGLYSASRFGDVRARRSASSRSATAAQLET